MPSRSGCCLRGGGGLALPDLCWGSLTWHKTRVEGHQAPAVVNLGVGPVGVGQALAKAVQRASHSFL